MIVYFLRMQVQWFELSHEGMFLPPLVQSRRNERVFSIHMAQMDNATPKKILETI